MTRPPLSLSRRETAVQSLADFAFHPPAGLLLADEAARHRRNAVAAMASVIVLHDPDPENAEGNLFELQRFKAAVMAQGITGRTGAPGPCGIGRLELTLREVPVEVTLTGTPAAIRAQWSRGAPMLAFADELERLRAAAVEGYLADPLPTLAVVRARAVAALRGEPPAE